MCMHYLWCFGISDIFKRLIVMEEYIPKAALVAEIKRRIELNNTCQKISGGNEFYRGAIDEAKEILHFSDTLEVKEIGVDIDSSDGDIGVKTIWDGDKIISNKAQKGEEL